MVTFKNILDRVYTTLFTDYKLDKLVEIDEQAFYDDPFKNLDLEMLYG